MLAELETLATDCAPPPPGLVGCWRGESDGLDSAGTNHGVLLNGVSFDSGLVGQAFHFASTANPRVYIPDNPALRLTNSLSVEAWVKANYGYALLNRGDDVTGELPYGFGFADLSSLKLSFIIHASIDEWVWLRAPTPIPSNVWVHVAATLDGDSGAMCIYVNGQVVAQTNTTVRPICPLTGANQSVCIGNAAGTAGFPFDGWIDEISLYSRALTPAEIQAIYNAGSSGKCEAPRIRVQPRSQVGYWGKSVTFDVVTEGSDPLFYQWQKGGQPIGGATDAALNLPNLQMTDAGSYAVVITNFLGRVTSAPAILTMNPAGVSIALHSGVSIDGVVGLTYGIQFTTDLNNTNSWHGLANITLNAPTQLWIDMEPASQPKRYYRVVPGPITVP